RATAWTNDPDHSHTPRATTCRAGRLFIDEAGTNRRAGMPRASASALVLRDYASDGVAEDVELDRLDQVQREAGAEGVFDVLFGAVAAHGDAFGRAGTIEHLAHEVIAAAVGQADV